MGHRAGSVDRKAFAARGIVVAPGAKHDLEILAALSHTTDFSVGCYCQQEERCHRSILRQLLVENGAKVE